MKHATLPEVAESRTPTVHWRIMRSGAWLLIGLALASSATAQIVVTVDVTHAVRTVNTHPFGINTAIWDDQFVSTATDDVLRRMQAGMLRFPGGSASDEYHWSTNRTENSAFAWPADFNAFARTATALGADVMITTNSGTDSAEEAAAWVRSANITSSRGYRYWEIGNEVYGSWEEDHHARPHDAWTYAEAAANYIVQMKGVDPSIRIGIPAVPGEDSFANYDDETVTNPRTGSGHKGWTPLVLSHMRELGMLPDFLSYHRYEQEPFGEDDQRLLNAASTWKSDMTSLRQMLTDYAGGGGAAIEILCTENNSVSSRPGKQTVSLVNALYLADSLAQSLQTEVGTVLWWDLRNGNESMNNNSPALFGWRVYGDYGVLSPANERYPTSYLAEMFAAFARPGDTVIDATSNSATLSAYAVERADASLAILLINKNRDQTVDVAIRFNGFSPANGDMPMLSYGMTNDIAQSDITRSNARLTAVRADPYSARVIVVPQATGRRRAVGRH